MSIESLDSEIRRIQNEKVKTASKAEDEQKSVDELENKLKAIQGEIRKHADKKHELETTANEMERKRLDKEKEKARLVAANDNKPGSQRHVA